MMDHDRSVNASRLNVPDWVPREGGSRRNTMRRSMAVICAILMLGLGTGVSAKAQSGGAGAKVKEAVLKIVDAVKNLNGYEPDTRTGNDKAGTNPSPGKGKQYTSEGLDREAGVSKEGGQKKPPSAKTHQSETEPALTKKGNNSDVPNGNPRSVGPDAGSTVRTVPPRVLVFDRKTGTPVRGFGKSLGQARASLNRRKQGTNPALFLKGHADYLLRYEETLSECEISVAANLGLIFPVPESSVDTANGAIGSTPQIVPRIPGTATGQWLPSGFSRQPGLPSHMSVKVDLPGFDGFIKLTRDGMSEEGGLHIWEGHISGDLYPEGTALLVYVPASGVVEGWVRLDADTVYDIWTDDYGVRVTNCISDDVSDEFPAALPATGQTYSYYPGDDGETRAGLPWTDADRLLDQGDGTVRDAVTGLIWLKDMRCLGTGSWYDALDRVSDLNADPTPFACAGLSASFRDWRVPNIRELSTLYNADAFSPGEWFQYVGFVNADLTNLVNVWSSTSRAEAGSTGQAWYRRLYHGASYTSDKGTLYQIFAVRGQSSVIQSGQSTSYYPGDDGAIRAGIPWAPEGRFTDNADGTVTDNMTGLMYLQDSNCMATHYGFLDTGAGLYDVPGDGQVPWEQALDFVAGINAGSYPACTAGYSDWRLPNLYEMHVLVDFSRVVLVDQQFPEGNPFLNLTGPYPVDEYWTSTTFSHPSTTAYAYFVSGSEGVLIQNKKTFAHRVLPVRDLR